jgi:hypothetical protein
MIRAAFFAVVTRILTLAPTVRSDAAHSSMELLTQFLLFSGVTACWEAC